MTMIDDHQDQDQTAAADPLPTDFVASPPPSSYGGDLAWSQAIDMHDDDRRPMSWPLRALLAAVGVSAVGLAGTVGAMMIVGHQSADAPPAATTVPSGMTTVTTAPPPITPTPVTTTEPPTSTVTVTTTPPPPTTTRYDDGDNSGNMPPTMPTQTVAPLDPTAAQNVTFLAKIANDGWVVHNPDTTIRAGRGVCVQLASGMSTFDIAKRFQAIDGYSFDAEDAFVVDAAGTFCPSLMR